MPGNFGNCCTCSPRHELEPIIHLFMLICWRHFPKAPSTPFAPSVSRSCLASWGKSKVMEKRTFWQIFDNRQLHSELPTESEGGNLSEWFLFLFRLLTQRLMAGIEISLAHVPAATQMTFTLVTFISFPFVLICQLLSVAHLSVVADVVECLWKRFQYFNY